MFNNKKAENLSITNTNINTLVGEGCQIKGDIRSKNSIKVDGEIQGHLNIEGSVIMGENSRIQGDIHCEDLIIFGRLDGNIIARQLHLKNSAQIYGNIEVQVLQVDPGAVYQGSVLMQSSTSNPNTAA